MELTLSPVYSAWDKQRLKNFYIKGAANMDVSTVYVGEVICQKRALLSNQDYKDIVSALKKSGKTVYMASLALITNKDELERTLQFAHLFDGIEVNSFGVLNLIIKDESLKDKDIIFGPFMNIYNSVATGYIKKFNPARLVIPYEVPYDTIKGITQGADIPVEVNAWGHLSTALSWRCYTARTFELGREDCRKKCFDFPEGILLNTIDDEDLYIMNGIQVLSSKIHCIIEQLDMLKEANVPYLRITPAYHCTADVVNIYSGVVNGNIDKKEAVKMLDAYAEHGLSNGWFLGKPGWEYIAA